MVGFMLMLMCCTGDVLGLVWLALILGGLIRLRLWLGGSLFEGEGCGSTHSRVFSCGNNVVFIVVSSTSHMSS